MLNAGTPIESVYPAHEDFLAAARSLDLEASLQRRYLDVKRVLSAPS
jgi:hypothetical protein